MNGFTSKWSMGDNHDPASLDHGSGHWLGHDLVMPMDYAADRMPRDAGQDFGVGGDPLVQVSVHGDGWAALLRSVASVTEILRWPSPSAMGRHGCASKQSPA
jgi:hypothetical protein